jgi:hypothetical protein
LLVGLLTNGCASRPSIERQTREADQEREAIKQQSEFARSLPP